MAAEKPVESVILQYIFSRYCSFLRCSVLHFQRPQCIAI